jgi:hypothetical protein
VRVGSRGSSSPGIPGESADIYHWGSILHGLVTAHAPVEDVNALWEAAAARAGPHLLAGVPTSHRSAAVSRLLWAAAKSNAPPAATSPLVALLATVAVPAGFMAVAPTPHWCRTLESAARLHTLGLVSEQAAAALVTAALPAMISRLRSGDALLTTVATVATCTLAAAAGMVAEYTHHGTVVGHLDQHVTTTVSQLPPTVEAGVAPVGGTASSAHEGGSSMSAGAATEQVEEGGKQDNEEEAMLQLSTGQQLAMWACAVHAAVASGELRGLTESDATELQAALTQLQAPLPSPISAAPPTGTAAISHSNGAA